MAFNETEKALLADQEFRSTQIKPVDSDVDPSEEGPDTEVSVRWPNGKTTFHLLADLQPEKLGQAPPDVSGQQH